MPCRAIPGGGPCLCHLPHLSPGVALKGRGSFKPPSRLTSLAPSSYATGAPVTFGPSHSPGPALTWEGPLHDHLQLSLGHLCCLAPPSRLAPPLICREGPLARLSEAASSPPAAKGSAPREGAALQ